MFPFSKREREKERYRLSNLLMLHYKAIFLYWSLG